MPRTREDATNANRCPPPTIQFTRDGEALGPALPAPSGANDVKVIWNSKGIVSAGWTRNCRVIGPPIPIPPGANDFHLSVPGYPAERMLEPGAEGDDVERLQEDLTILGHAVGDLDGRYGAKTSEAVRRVQRATGIPETGVADSETANAIKDQVVELTAAAFESLTRDELTTFVRLLGDLNNDDEGPKHKDWRERLKREFVKNMREEGIDEKEIEKIVKDFLELCLQPTIFGLIKYLAKQGIRIYKVLKAFKKAKKAVGDEPPFSE